MKSLKALFNLMKYITDDQRLGQDVKDDLLGIATDMMRAIATDFGEGDPIFTVERIKDDKIQSE